MNRQNQKFTQKNLIYTKPATMCGLSTLAIQIGCDSREKKHDSIIDSDIKNPTKTR